MYEDSFARTQDVMLEGLRAACQKRLDSGELVLVVTHFAAPFEHLQEKFAEWDLDYEILDERVGAGDLVRRFDRADTKVLLGLAELFCLQETVNENLDKSKCISAVIVERHPLGHKDDQLQTFFRALSCRVEMGYFLSFQDVTVKNVVNDAAIRILDMFGMGENELVTSNMVSRRLKSLLKLNSKNCKTDQAADSAEQWFQLNLPQSK